MDTNKILISIWTILLVDVIALAGAIIMLGSITEHPIILTGGIVLFGFSSFVFFHYYCLKKLL